MDRELRFRVWSNKNKCWRDNDRNIINLNGVLKYQAIDGSYWEYEDGECVIMQSTGLKDKNGKDIYEGDIIKVDQFIKYTHQVKYFGAQFTGRIIEYDLRNTSEYLGDLVKKGCKVIGNIYENPELLTQLESKPEPEVKHASEDIGVDPCAHENKTFTDGITNCFDCGKIL